MCPHLSLPIPLGDGSDGPEILLPDRVTSLGGLRQEEDFFLDIWGEVEQVHDLGDTRPTHVTQPGQIGQVSYFSMSDQAIEPDR